ncbi:MAG: winged helix-turn-helix domain-containing protein [Lysobacteraceae bacterium]
MSGGPPDVIAGVLELDRLVHEPARLALLTVLSQVEAADFSFLELASGLTKGNLSSHLGKLEAAGLVTVDKGYRGRRPHTRLALTADGRQALSDYRRQLASFIGATPDPMATSGEDPA